MAKVKLLLTGGSGRLGKYIIENIDKNKYDLLSPTSKELDITNTNCLTWLDKNRPDVILHSAAYTDSKKSKEEFSLAININVIGTLNLLQYSIKNNVDFIYISTDAVFDGEKGNYKPSDSLNPISNYAKTKTAAELCCRTYPKCVIIRTSFFDKEFPYEEAFNDQYTSKDYLKNIGPKILKVIEDYKYGIYHIGTGKKSLYDLAVKTKSHVKKTSIKNFNLKIPKDASFNEEEIFGNL